jgi:CHAT domain-containing protein
LSFPGPDAEKEQAVRALVDRLGVLILLAACMGGASGQPTLASANKTGAPPAPAQLLAEAQQLNDEGLRLHQRGDFRAALPRLQQALTLRRQAYPRASHPDGHPDLAASLNNLGTAQQAAGDYAKAETLLAEALAMRHALYPRQRCPAGHPDLAASLNNLGILHVVAGAFARAEPLLREALAMNRSLYPAERYPYGHPQLARSLHNLAYLHRCAGENGQAEPLLRQALAMRRALYPPERFPAGHPELAVSLNNLARLYWSAGETAQAEPLLREALAMCRALYRKEQFPRGHPALANSLASLGVVYTDAGNYAQAEPLLHEAVAVCRALYPRKDFPAGHPELARSLHNLASLHQHAGDYARAEPLLAEVLAMRRALYPTERFPAGHPELAVSLNNLGFLYHCTGERARAEALYREALAMFRALYPPDRYPAGHPDLATIIHNMGRHYAGAGARARAEPLLREALAMDGRLLRQFADLAAEAESRSFAGTLPRSRDAFLASSRRLAQPAAAYAALWDGRALLTRLLEQRHRDLLATADPAAAALAEELGRTRRRLAALLLRPGRDADAHRQVVEQLTRAKEELEKRIAARLRLAALKPAAAASTAHQLRDALPAGAAFVDLLRYVDFEQDPKTPGTKGEKRTASYAAFVVARGRPLARVELGEAVAIEAAWAAWHKALLAPAGDQRAERAAARAFAKLAWEPVRAALPADCRAMYLTPDGALAQVPWAALPGRQPGTVLLDEHAVCLVPHGPWLLERMQAKPMPGGGDTLLAYGGIDYEGAPAAGAKSRGPRQLELVGTAALPVPGGERLHWAALPGTAREQERVVALAREALKDPPLVRSGRGASTDQLLEDLPKARYAHLATHGFFADPQFRSYLQVDPRLYEQRGFGERHTPGGRSPLVLSGLVLAGANRRGEDAAPDRGVVTAEGLIGLRLEGLELAVLSACDTGLGEVAGGEGVFGLQRAFHLAGCKDVVASLWQVDDEAAAALMALFYHNLWREKLAPAEALRRAQLTLYHHPECIPQMARARGPDFDRVVRRPAEARPGGARAPTRLWAGFVLSGAGR